jgi:peptidoglycan/LPS O-acetylase OafA/YrhL
MKWLSYTLAALLAAAVTISIVGIVTDSARLDLWTQVLMWCMLGTVVLVPVAVYAGTRPTSEMQVSEEPPAGFSPVRLAAYTFSVGAIVWTAISMVSLFVDPENLAFWTQSVLWSLLVLVVLAPIMAFFFNPFQTPRRTPPTESTVDPAPDFVDHEASALSSPPAAAVVEPSQQNVDDEESRADSRPMQDDAQEDNDDRGWPYV